MTITFSLAKVPCPPPHCWKVRLFLSTTAGEDDRPRDSNAALAIVDDLMRKRASELPDDERLISDDAMPDNAVPLFRFYLTVKHTRYGLLFAREYTRYDGCPAAVSTEGMHLNDYVWSRLNKINKATKHNAELGKRVSGGLRIQGEEKE